jgi:hypothetical protein
MMLSDSKFQTAKAQVLEAVIASEAKQSIAQQVRKQEWIASLRSQ